MSGKDNLEVNLELERGFPFLRTSTVIQSKFSNYEETYDGTSSGWYKFRKDVADTLNLKNDKFVIFLKSRDRWFQVNSGKGLDNYLNEARKTQVIYVRIKTHEKGIVFYMSLGGILTLIGIGTIYLYRCRKESSSWDIFKPLSSQK